MALPAALIPAAGWAATKLGGALTAAKGLMGLGTAAKAAGGVGSAMKAGSMIPGVLGNAGTRMAGDAMFKSGIGNAIFGQMTKGDIMVLH